MIENAIFESICTYEFDDAVLADFLGVRCKNDMCEGIIYPPSRVHAFLSSALNNGNHVKGHIIFTNHPKDIIEFFRRKENSLRRDSGCYYAENSYASLKYQGRVHLLGDGRLRISLKIVEVCKINFGAFLPLNRFTNLLLELLVNLTKQRYYCLTGNYDDFDKLAKINEYYLEVLRRLGKDSLLLMDIVKDLEKTATEWGSCKK